MRKNMAVRRLDLGYFIRPASEVGGPQPRVEPVLAYLVQHDNGLLLFDTGIGDADPETEAHYRPRRRALRDALSASGVALADPWRGPLELPAGIVTLHSRLVGDVFLHPAAAAAPAAPALCA